MSPHHVLIIGGGIGGLTLAQGLKKHGIPFTLFERDASPAARAQGYRIRIAGDGADSLQECVDETMWSLFERTCAQMQPFGSKINAIDGTTKDPAFTGGKPKFGKTKPGEPGHRAYTVDRTMLRNLLLLGQEGHVKFNKTFQRYSITSTGVKAFFADGTSEEGTLLVGADGIRSRIRAQLHPSHRFLDLGSRVIYGKTLITPELTSKFPTDALRGMAIIQDEKPVTLFLEPVRFPNDASIESNGQLTNFPDYVYWVVGFHQEQVDLSDDQFLTLSGKESAELTLKLAEKWEPKIRSLFELQSVNQAAPLRVISAKPERPEWPQSDRVVLLGDAAHVMPPAGGVGANAALADVALLVRLIAEEGVSQQTLEKFNIKMWDYALPLLEGSGHGAAALLGFKGYESAKEIDI